MPHKIVLEFEVEDVNGQNLANAIFDTMNMKTDYDIKSVRVVSEEIVSKESWDRCYGF